MSTPRAPLSNNGKSEAAYYVTARAASLGVGLVLMMAGISHLANPYYFMTRIIAYDLVSPRTALALALALPSLEVVLGACFIWRILPYSAHLTAAVMVTSFAVAQIAALSRGLEIDCGCFGPAAPELISTRTITRTIMLDVAVVLACFCEYSISKRPGASSKGIFVGRAALDSG